MQYSYAWVTRSCLFLKFFLIHKHESRSYSDSRKCTLKKIRFLLSRYRFVCVFFFLFFFVAFFVFCFCYFIKSTVSFVCSKYFLSATEKIFSTFCIQSLESLTGLCLSRRPKKAQLLHSPPRPTATPAKSNQCILRSHHGHRL